MRDLRGYDIQIEEGFIVIPNDLVFEEAKKVKQQILTNQEDAIEMRKIQSAGIFSVEEVDTLANRDVVQRAIIKRLDKRIEEVKNLDIEIKKDQLWSWGAVVDELQAIREGEK